MYKFKHVFMQQAGGEGDKGGQPPQGGTPPQGTPPASGGAWYDSFKDPETKEWLKAYGTAYPDPESVARKALNLEKFVGSEKSGRGIVMPKPEDDPKVWRDFFAKVGGAPVGFP